MIILKNETKKIISVLKKDYTHLQIQPLSQVQIDEKLVKFIPSEIKQLSTNEVETKKTQPVKKEKQVKTIFEEKEAKIEEVKPVKEENIQETEVVKEENIQETKKPQPKRRGRKPKKETE